jgi:hypothetical protein
MQLGLGLHLPVSTSSGQQPARQGPTVHVLPQLHEPPSVGLPCVQVPPEQLSPAWQGLPQPPQLFGSLVTSVHTWLQHIDGELQPWQAATVVHAPAMQVWLAAQARPHTPQLLASSMRALQPDVPQQVWPVPHSAMPLHRHEPPVQVEPDGHTWPQLPQFDESVEVATHTSLQHDDAAGQCAQEPPPPSPGGGLVPAEPQPTSERNATASHACFDIVLLPARAARHGADLNGGFATVSTARQIAPAQAFSSARAMSSANDWISPASGPSTITRALGSVPE